MRIKYLPNEQPDEFQYLSNIEQRDIDGTIYILADYTGKKTDVIEFIEDVRKEKLEALNNSVNEKFKAYLEKYPDVEVQSFTVKSSESAKVAVDPNTPLTDTPYLSALTNNNLEARNALAEAVNAKVKENAELEAFAVQTRDAIKACKTQAELDAIKW